MADCVVPENIYTPPTKGNGNSEGSRVGKKGGNFRGDGGRGLLTEVFSRGSELDC